MSTKSSSVIFSIHADIDDVIERDFSISGYVDEIIGHDFLEIGPYRRNQRR
jgi:hypothetical protein